jgi:hypothetical protein
LKAERKISLLWFLLALTTTLLPAISSASSTSLFDDSSRGEELFRVLVTVVGIQGNKLIQN